MLFILLFKEQNMKTINYYNKNAQKFYDNTINTDIRDIYKKFLKYLPKKSHILDVGCGVGRDIKYFLSEGYIVSGLDASFEMVKLATQETGVNIMHSTFQDLNFDKKFDAVWAQASLLHVPYDLTQEIYQKIHNALKPRGIFYASYRHGDSYMATSERDFYNMNEEIIIPYFSNLFEIIELWQNVDNRVTKSPSGMWLNFIVRKI